MAVTTAAHRLGRRGEQFVADQLAVRGWEILARNWRCPEGELDIVARDPDGVLVVVEVKCRSGLGYGSPLEAITRRKVAKLRGLAVRWLREHSEPGADLRIDAVGVVMPRRGSLSWTHVQGIEQW
ncbi:MAG: YraN family protein [Arachnia sp.]